MNKNYRLPATVCALAVCLALCFAVAAWVGPSGNPPDSNIAAPINAGSEAQYKTGGLGVKIGGAVTYWISQIGNNLVFKAGDDFDTATSTVNINTDGRIGNVTAPIDDKDAVNKAYLDAQASGGGTGYGTCTGTMLDIKFTMTKYKGNLGGIAAADAKCAAEYPDYHFCQYAELKTAGFAGCLPSTSQYLISGAVGWYHGVKNLPYGMTTTPNCTNWTSTSSMQYAFVLSQTLSDGGSAPVFVGVWTAEDDNYYAFTCSTLRSIACCKQI